MFDLETVRKCLDLDCNQRAEVWSSITPMAFMAFLYGLILLLGSGDVIRNIREGATQSINSITKTDTFEFLAFGASLLVANIIGFHVFENQDWDYFGFFVLAQGFGLFGLSEYFKEKGLYWFEQLALGFTMVSIIFATIWEVGAEQLFVLSLMLIGEGLLFCLAGDKLKAWIFHLFGKVSLVCAFVFIFGIESLVESAIAVGFYVLVTLHSAKIIKTGADKVWAAIGVGLSTIQIFYWSFGSLDAHLSPDAWLYILPTLWAVGVAYSSFKTKQVISNFLGLGLILFVGMMGINEIVGTSKIWPAGLLTLLLMAGSFAVLASFFMDHKGLKINDGNRRMATILTLSLTTGLALFFGGDHLDEPVRTLAWIVWGGLLLVLGSQNQWPHFRYFGIGMLCVIIAKLYIIDVWNWEVMVRFVAFFALGLALLSISFLYAKNDKK